MRVGTDVREAILPGADERLREAERFHMGIGQVHQTVRELADDLNRAGIAYAIIGGMALNAHGYRRETIDVDLLVRPEGLDAFHAACTGRGSRPAFAGARKRIRNTRTNTTIDFIAAGEPLGVATQPGRAFPDPVAVAVEIDGVRYANLETLIDLKLISGTTQPARRKDIGDVQELIRTRKLDAALADRLSSDVRELYRTLVREVQTAEAQPPDE